MENADDLIIAKMDCMANELDEPYIDIQEVPTILFFPNGKRDAPIAYKGSRELNDLVEFLTEHATKHFDVERKPTMEKASENSAGGAEDDKGATDEL